MITIKNDKNNTERKQFFNRIRLALFKINHQTLQLMKNNSLIYKLLHMIGFLQLIYFTLNPKIPGMWTMNFIVYLRTICKYFQMEENLTGISSNAWYTVMICFLGFMALLLLSVGYMVIRFYKEKAMNVSGGFFQIVSAVSSLGLILYETILVVPIS